MISFLPDVKPPMAPPSALPSVPVMMSIWPITLWYSCVPRPVARFGDASYTLLYQGDCGDAALAELTED